MEVRSDEGVVTPAKSGDDFQFSEVSQAIPVFRQVAEQLIRAIESGHYPVGSRMPGEKELANMFGVSRPSVREALSCLQFEGYIEPRRGSRTIVISSVDRGSYRSHPLNGSGPHSPIDVMETRLLLEPHVVGLAASDPDPRELKALRSIVAGMQLDLVESPQSSHAHSDLVVHTALVRVCKNKVLGGFAEQLFQAADDDVFARARVRAWDDREIPREWLRHHQTIVGAVMDRDPEAASSACRSHLLSVLGQIVGSGQLTEETKARVEILMKEQE